MSANKIVSPKDCQPVRLSADNVSPKDCQPQNHPASNEYVCGCGAGADVWDRWGVYCAKCYLDKGQIKRP